MPRVRVQTAPAAAERPTGAPTGAAYQEVEVWADVAVAVAPQAVIPAAGHEEVATTRAHHREAVVELDEDGTRYKRVPRLCIL